MKPVIIIAIAVVFGIGIGLSLSVSAEEELIPSWIKNIALMFGQDQISDSEFIGALQYLVKEGILVIPSEQDEKNRCISTYRSRIKRTICFMEL